ncbi:MAG: HAMP domain-containing histidine kinase [Chloroflexi bacterium]|nr:HAMP domain-containing histidine kinase [Chloroflexota bacterium]
MCQRWANRSLRVQLSLAVMLIMMFLLAMFSAVLFIAVRSFILEQTAEQLRARAEVVLGDSATPPATVEAWSWDRLPTASLSQASRGELQGIVEVLTTPETSVVVYDTDGSVLLQGTPEISRSHFPPFGPFRQAARPPVPPVPPEPNRREFERAYRGDEEIRFTSERGNDQELSVLVPIYEGQNLVGIMQLATPLRQSLALLRWLAVALVLGTLIVGFTALILSLWATRTILNPLQRVIHASQRVGHGDLTARTELRSRNEIGVLGSTFDQMVRQLQSSFATQRRFIADAAHELRTPLTAVSGNVDLLMLGAASDPAQQRRALQRMNSELERMGRLVDDLLTLSRLDSQPTLHRNDIDLNSLAHDLVEQFRDLAPRHQWQLRAMDGVIVSGDGDRLRQVLLNVLENARKYTPEGGAVSVTVEAEQDSAVVQIADTGIGIPAEDVPHVWDRFYRIDQARTRAGGGFGLGLAIVKSIVESHGGQVALTSEAGQGTIVTLRLPLAPSARSAPLQLARTV